MFLVRKLNTVFLQIPTLSAFSLTESIPAQCGDDQTKTHWFHCEVPFLLIFPTHDKDCDVPCGSFMSHMRHQSDWTYNVFNPFAWAYQGAKF